MFRMEFISSAWIQNHPKYVRELSLKIIMKKRQFKYIENFTTKDWKFSDKNSEFFSYFFSKQRL